MKKSTLLFFLLMPLYSIPQSKLTIQKAKTTAVQYIKENALKPKSYVPISWTKLSVIHTSFHTSLEGKAMLLKSDEIKANYKTSVSKRDSDLVDRRIDSLKKIDDTLEANFQPQSIYTFVHAFKLKTLGGYMTLKVYTFCFDINLKVTNVDTDSPEEQIEREKLSIEDNKKEIEFNNFMRDYAIRKLKEKFKGANN